MKPFLTEQQVCDLLGVRPPALQAGRNGRGAFATLPYLKLGRLVRYDQDVVEEFRQRDIRCAGAAVTK